MLTVAPAPSYQFSISFVVKTPPPLVFSPTEDPDFVPFPCVLVAVWPRCPCVLSLHSFFFPVVFFLRRRHPRLHSYFSFSFFIDKCPDWAFPLPCSFSRICFSSLGLRRRDLLFLPSSPSPPRGLRPPSFPFLFFPFPPRRMLRQVCSVLFFLPLTSALRVTFPESVVWFPHFSRSFGKVTRGWLRAPLR